MLKLNKLSCLKNGEYPLLSAVSVTSWIKDVSGIKAFFCGKQIKHLSERCGIKRGNRAFW